nr:MAG TPA: hypothetical protein [Bacteriophage sp.]
MCRDINYGFEKTLSSIARCCDVWVQFLHSSQHVLMQLVKIHYNLTSFRGGL